MCIRDRATGARNTSMVKIRDGLRPEKLKLDHTPTEFKNWKEEVKTYFTASNLMYASNREQRGYFRTCLSAELATISKKKLELGNKIQFAGHIISDEGIQPDEDKYKAIKDFLRPKNLKDTRAFLGLANQLPGRKLNHVHFFI